MLSPLNWHHLNVITIRVRQHIESENRKLEKYREIKCT